MTYISGSMTNSDAPATLAGLMHTALLNAGFTLVDTVVIGTRTHKVYKSAAANNTEGIDWYLDLAYTTSGAGSIWLGAFETYDAVAHTAGLGPYSNIESTVDAAEFSRYGTTKYALETNWTHITRNLAQIETASSAFAYWISITPTRVIALTSVNATKVVYCGQFAPYAPWKAKVAEVTPGKWNPLITCNISNPAVENTSTMGSGSLTRIPPATTVYRWDYTCNIRSSSSSSSSGSSSGGVGGPAGFVDTGWSPYLAGGPQGDKIQIAISRNVSVNNVGGWGHGAGWLYDIARFGTSGATSVTRGDTTTVSGNTWALASANSGACFGFKAA